MEKRKTLFFILTFVSLVGLGLLVGNQIGVWGSGIHPTVVAGNSLMHARPSVTTDFFSQEFASSTELVPVRGLATGGLSDALLKSGVWKSLLDYERKQNCADVTSQTIEVEQINEEDVFWIEDWSVNVCGTIEVFKIKFAPDPVGGTVYEIGYP